MSLASEVYVTPLSDPSDGRVVQLWDLSVPLTGNWSMRLEMAGDSVLPDGPVEIQVAGSRLRGLVLRAGDDRGQYIGIVAGSTAPDRTRGLGVRVSAQHFLATPARDVVQRTLAECGEGLSPDSQGLEQTLSPGYARRAIRGDEVMDEVADMLGLTWRVGLDGLVLFERWPRTTWPATQVKFVYQSKQPDTASPLVMPLPDQPLILPGQSVVLDASAAASLVDRTPQRVSYSHYYATPDRLEARLWLQDPQADLFTDDKLASDPVHAGIAKIARAALRGADWFRTYQGEVVTQREDGTLDVNLDQIPGGRVMPPIRGARVSVPVGGAALAVRAGDRVSVYYEGGDPRKARCGLYETGAGSRGVALLGSTGTAGTLVLTVVGGVLGGSYTDPSGVSTPVTSGSPINLKCKLTGDVSQDLKLRG